MSGETLRGAAARIRADWPVAEDAPLSAMSGETAFHLAVADWLDKEAPYNQGPNSPALAAARAYLGTTP